MLTNASMWLKLFYLIVTHWPLEELRRVCLQERLCDDLVIWTDTAKTEFQEQVKEDFALQQDFSNYLKTKTYAVVDINTQ